jgi:D-glycero-alpha-D-manno-heptose 1-phosphate guanylyltransferase
MAPVNDKPFLEYLLNFLTGQDIQRVILSVGHKHEMIENYFKDRYKHISISYAFEDEPLGTGGGIVNALQQVEGEMAFAMNGDSMFRIDLQAMLNHHLKNEADLTIALRFLDDTSRFGTVKIDSTRRVTGFVEKKQDSGEGYINGGIYLINKRFLTSSTFGKKFSIEKDCFEKCYKNSGLYGFPAKGYFLDIGVPEDYMTAQDEFKRFED